MEALLYFSASVYVLYTLVTLFKFGVLSSISESHYKWGGGVLSPFFLFCFSVGFSMMIYLLSVLPEPYKFAGFLCGSGLLFAGFASNFKSISDKTAHFLGAAISMIGAVIIIINYNMIVHIIFCLWLLLFISFYNSAMQKNLLFFIEHTIFIFMFVVLFAAKL